MSNETHAGLLIAEVLQRHGVRFVFTLCGGHISPILVGCKQRGMRVIDVRDEATTVFAADAVARLSGVPGVAAVTAGPGVTNTITAVKNAQMAQSPVIILGGATATLLKGRGSLQDIDQFALIKPHVKWATAVRRVRDVVPALRRAFAIAESDVPGPVFIEFPVDLLYPPSLVRQWYGLAGDGGAKDLRRMLTNWYLERHVRRMFAPSDATELTPLPVTVPTHSSHKLRTAADWLNDAARPVLVIGSQATLNAREVTLLRDAVDTLGIPTYLAGMARGLLGQTHRLQFRHHRKQALKEADLVILAGIPMDFRLSYGREFGRRTRIVSINRSAAELRRNRRPDLALHADAAEVLRALAGRVDATQSSREAWFDLLRAREAEREREIDREAVPAATTINMVRLCRQLEETIAEDSVIVGDGGDFVATASYIVRPRGPLRWIDPGAFGTLGGGAGFALGAKLCYPEAEVWILYGDGSVGYSLAEFDTFVRHEIPVIAVVGNDASWRQIARDQVELLGDDVGTVLRHTDYHRVAQGFDAEGLCLRTDDDILPGLRRAQELAAQGEPVLVNAIYPPTDFRKGSLSM